MENKVTTDADNSQPKRSRDLHTETVPALSTKVYITGIFLVKCSK